MLPRKNRKEITVDGVLYHYVVKGYVSIIIRNSETGKISKWSEDWKSKWGAQIKPGDVRKFILDLKVDKDKPTYKFKSELDKFVKGY